MNDIELTQVFIDYAHAKEKLAALEYLITEEVLQRGESVKIAGVEARYYKPSPGTPDYETAAKMVIPNGFDLRPYMTVTTTIRWKEVCQALGKEPDPGMERPAKVLIK